MKNNASTDCKASSSSQTEDEVNTENERPNAVVDVVGDANLVGVMVSNFFKLLAS